MTTSDDPVLDHFLEVATGDRSPPQTIDLEAAGHVIRQLPRWLYEERQRRQLSYRQWQAECGISSSYLFKMLTADKVYPSADTLLALLNWLSTSLQIDMDQVPAVYLRNTRLVSTDLHGNPYLMFNHDGTTVVTKSVTIPPENPDD